MHFAEFKQRYQKVPVEEYPNRVCEAMPSPVVSVKVSTYQHADFIRECLDGILMQETSFPFEIVIGEDESTDGTREICIEYAGRHPDKIRLFLHSRENNIHIDRQPTPKFQSVYSYFMCRGKYIAWCEGDDYWTDARKLQKQVDFLEARDEYVLSCHGAKIVNGSGEVVEESKLPESLQRDFTQEELMTDAFVLTLSVCFRNVIEEFPPEYFEVINADIFLISLLGQHGKGKFQHEIEPAVYRVHGGGIWSTLNYCNQLEMNIRTKQHMHRYYQRVGNKAIARRMRVAYRELMESLVHTAMSARNVRLTLKYFFLLTNEYLADGEYDSVKELWGSVARRVIPFSRKATSADGTSSG